MATKNNWVAIVVVVAAAAVLLEKAAAATYYVGESLGWMVPPGGPSVYTTWASQHTFIVGDVLVFNFTTGQHTAAKVTLESFNACNTSNYIQLQTTGPASYTLQSAGQNYFFCTQSNHCSLGQKLQVNATSGTGSPTPPGSSPPPPPPGTTTTPPPPPPPRSSAPSSANIATFSFIFMSIVIAFLC